MNALHTLGGVALGLAIPLAGLVNLGQSDGLAAQGLRAAGAEILATDRPRANVAEVAVAFDPTGRVAASRVRRSSGSPATDAAAVTAAIELASLRRPAEVAGRTLLFKTSFDAPAAFG